MIIDVVCFTVYIYMSLHFMLLINNMFKFSSTHSWGCRCTYWVFVETHYFNIFRKWLKYPLLHLVVKPPCWLKL